jgi:hypothetical protein
MSSSAELKIPARFWAHFAFQSDQCTVKENRSTTCDRGGPDEYLVCDDAPPGHDLMAVIQAL